MDENTQNTIGPAPVSFTTFILKILAAGVGGTLGALILLIIFVLGSTILGPLTDPTKATDVNPAIFVFVVMIMIFLSSTASNLLSTFLISLTEHEKYRRTASAMYQIFIVSMIVFILMVPVYFLTVAIDPAITVYAVAMHIIITTQMSALILEIVSNYKYALVGVYGVCFSVILSAAIMFGLTKIGLAPAILFFLALPVVWGSLAFVQNIMTALYGWIARTYDKDFLSTQEVYGADYGNEVESAEDAAPQAKDEEGADFLRHN